jgi:hypothetical protein
MNVAITGDRAWGSERYQIVYDALTLLDPTSDFVILGDARGVDSVDTHAQIACIALGLSHKIYKAQWKTEDGHFRRWAGPERNGWMLDHPADMVWYFHDNLEESKGTRNCVKQAHDRDIPVYDGQIVTGVTWLI